MNIDGFEIGKNGVFIIAEVGSNHGGSIAIAKDHISAAAEAGANAVKFQSLNQSRLYLNPSDSTVELHNKIDMHETWHSELKRHADKHGILFSSSPTYLEAVRILNKVDVPFFKIASAQAGTFPQLIEAVAKTEKPVLFSTGISDYQGISRNISAFKRAGNHNFGILHCNSVYPTPPEVVNLERMGTYKKMFKCPVGFSDHTEGTAISLAAVALGADVLEKHFRLPDFTDSPDASFSITVDELAKLVIDTNNITDACKDKPRNGLESCEEIFKEAIRYRLILKERKKAGATFSPADFDYLRNPEGIDVAHEELICNSFKSVRDLDGNYLLSWADLTGCQ